MTKVSVIIGTYNRAAFLRESIESVLGQDFEDFELIVVDDGSADDTENVVRRFGERVLYVKIPHSGPSRARNTGIKEATGEYIAFNDDDDLLLEGSLRRRSSLLNIHSEAGFVFSDLCLFNEAGTLTQSWMSERVVFSSIPKKVLEPGCYGFETGIYPFLAKERFMTIPTLMIRRTCLERIGGFDETLSYNEDYDLFLRLVLACTPAYVERPLAACRVHENNISGNRERRFAAGIPLWRKFAYEFKPLPDDYRRQARHQLAHAYYRLGYFYLERGLSGKARRHFAKAWRLKPSHYRHGLYLLFSLAPKPIRAGLRKIKRMIF